MNYILGTQQIGGKYQFTDNLLEQINIVENMGMNQVKISDTDPCFLDIIDIPQFTRIFMLFRSREQNFIKIFGQQDEKTEYNAVYNFVTEILKKYNGTQKHFYLGNSKGDFYILNFMDTTQNANPEKISNMVRWVNIRQKAVSDARNNTLSSVSRLAGFLRRGRLSRDWRRGWRRLLGGSMGWRFVMGQLPWTLPWRLWGSGLAMR